MKIRIAVAVLFLSLGVHAQEPPAGAADADLFARDTYRIDPLVCPFRGSIDYEPGEIECGLLQVPENREKPDSRFIELHFVKLKSTWDEEDEAQDEDDTALPPGRRDDPVIYLTGGPGSGVEYYVGRFIDHGIRKHRDLYILEQRGIGTSGDFCTNYYARKPATFNVATLEAQAEAQRTAARDCALNAQAAGADLTAYNTIENARDVRALRQALGFDQWNVWGISYGTILGQAYIKADAAGIRAIVLDAIVPLDTRRDPEFWRAVKWYDRVLQKLDALCQADAGCAKAYPDLGARVRDAARAVMAGSIAVDVQETELYPSGKAYFLSDVAAFLPFVLFYEQSGYPALPGVIYRWGEIVAARDETVFKAIALSGGTFFDGSQGMYDAIMCNDGHVEAQVPSVQRDRDEFPDLQNAFSAPGSELRQVQHCIDLGMPARDAAEYALVETDIPALLVEGDMDPITPPPLAHAIEAGFANGTYVEFPYAGHGPSRSVDCAGDMLNRFFDEPGRDPDLGCVGEMKPPEFLVPFYATAVVPRFIVLAEENEESLPAVAAWAGTSVLLVVNAFIVLSFAPLVRRIERRNAAASGGARIAAWTAALFGTAALAILGAAAAATYELSEIFLLFGLVPWARFGAWAAIAAGLLGVAAVVLALRARSQHSLPAGALTGLCLTGLGAIGLSAFLLYWGIGP